MEVIVHQTQQLSVTLPVELVQQVREKVATGEYATESEVILDGLQVLLARGRAVESWLWEEVSPAYDALKADPSRAIPVEHVRKRVAMEHEKATSRR